MCAGTCASAQVPALRKCVSVQVLAQVRTWPTCASRNRLNVTLQN